MGEMDSSPEMGAVVAEPMGAPVIVSDGKEEGRAVSFPSVGASVDGA
jgi:hypothetical protein